MKLYNNSKLDTAIILKVLKEIQRLSKVKGDPVVIITNGKRGGGIAYDNISMRCKRWFKHNKWVGGDGFVKINPLLRESKYHKYDPLVFSEYFCEVALHEFRHLYQFQQRIFGFYNTGIAHCKRPQEIDAHFFSRYEVKVNDDVVLELALNIEKILKGYK